jgi:hypothetical protein
MAPPRYNNAVRKTSDSDFQDHRSFSEKMAMPEVRESENRFYDNEFEKHLVGMRARYPMITQLLLRSPGIDNANLSNINNTNKYARLADAYNAQMRYVGPNVHIGFGSAASMDGGDAWAPVEKIITQDQKQMEELRKAQSDIRAHQLSEESHYNRELLRAKMGEMGKLVDQDYQQRFFDANEQMRRVSAIFDNWQKMDLAEFTTVMEKLGIPKEKAESLQKMLKNGDYLGYAIQAEAYGLTAMDIDNIYNYTTMSGIVQGLASGKMTPEMAAKEIGRLKGHAAIQQLVGLKTALAQSGDPTFVKVEEAIDKIIPDLLDLGVDIADKPGVYAAIYGICTLLGATIPAAGSAGVSALVRRLAGAP